VRAPHEQWERAAAGLQRKYPQYQAIPMFAGEPTMIRFAYARWKSWSAGGAVAAEAWLASGMGAAVPGIC